MNRRVADGLVAGIAGFVLLLGAIWSVQAARQPAGSMNGTMGSMMDGYSGTYGTNPFVYLLAAVVVAVVIAAGYYLVVRDQVAVTASTGTGTVPSEVSDGESVGEMTEGTNGPEENAGEPGTETVESGDRDSRSPTERELLRYLPDDERRVLEPVIDSPGVTQIEIRDRSDFSKSKVSQTLSDLEKRGLVAKEKQGRTFRVYPGEELTDAESA